MQFNGFPQLSEYIELPDIPDLLKSPIMLNLDAEFAYKNGGELIRYLLDKTPMKNNQKHMFVTSMIQFLTPEFSPVRSDVLPVGDWHVDGTGLNSRDTYYLMLSESDWGTEFNSNPVIIDGFNESSDQGQLVRYINHNDVGLIPKKLEGNRIATFDGLSIHRAGKAEKPAFRYMWRVGESDFHKPLPVNDFSYKTSYVFKYKIPFPNIKQVEDGVIIY